MDALSCDSRSCRESVSEKEGDGVMEQNVASQKGMNDSLGTGIVLIWVVMLIGRMLVLILLIYQYLWLRILFLILVLVQVKVLEF